MRFSSLFRVMGKDVEMEVYQTNPRRYICSVTEDSRVPIEVWRSEVESVTPFTTDRMIVFIRRYVVEHKDQDVIYGGLGTDTHAEKAVSRGKELEDTASEGAV